MIIQIYEIQSPEEARIMIDLGVDHVGSVLTPDQDWKNPELKAAIEMVQAAGRKSALIPLSRDLDRIARALDYYAPNMVHFCETLWNKNDPSQEALYSAADRQQRLRQKFPEMEIMRSIPVSGEGTPIEIPSLELARIFEPISDWFLTDTLLGPTGTAAEESQPVNGYIGITGRVCDWQVAHDLVRTSPIPVILAGGIGPDNVAAAVARVVPAGVDSCTLTNKVDGQGKPIRFQKDPEKVQRMIQAARHAAAHCT